MVLDRGGAKARARRADAKREAGGVGLFLNQVADPAFQGLCRANEEAQLRVVAWQEKPAHVLVVDANQDRESVLAHLALFEHGLELQFRHLIRVLRLENDGSRRFGRVI